MPATGACQPAFLHCFDEVTGSPAPAGQGVWLGFRRGRGRQGSVPDSTPGASSGILRAVSYSHFPARANFTVYSVFKMWGHTSLPGNIVVLFISHRLYGVFLAEQRIGFGVPTHRFRGLLTSLDVIAVHCSPQR